MTIDYSEQNELTLLRELLEVTEDLLTNAEVSDTDEDGKATEYSFSAEDLQLLSCKVGNLYDFENEEVTED